MALDDKDNFVVEKFADSKLYKVHAGLLQQRLLDGDFNNLMLVWSGNSWVPGPFNQFIPDGDTDNPVLVWNGTGWAPGTIDGGVYATVREGIVTNVGIDVVGTCYDNGVITYQTESVSGSGSGLTVEVRYSSGTWTPGYLFVVEGGEGYEVGDQVRVLGGNNDKIIEITGITEESSSEDY